MLRIYIFSSVFANFALFDRFAFRSGIGSRPEHQREGDHRAGGELGGAFIRHGKGSEIVEGVGAGETRTPGARDGGIRKGEKFCAAAKKARIAVGLEDVDGAEGASSPLYDIGVRIDGGDERVIEQVVWAAVCIPRVVGGEAVVPKVDRQLAVVTDKIGEDDRGRSCTA